MEKSLRLRVVIYFSACYVENYVMYVHSGDTSVNLSAYVCDYSWGAYKMYALYIVLNWSVTFLRD
jgi:hypothetical protein